MLHERTVRSWNGVIGKSPAVFGLAGLFLCICTDAHEHRLISFGLELRYQTCYKAGLLKPRQPGVPWV